MKNVLKLNLSWIPVDTCSPEEAFKLLAKGNATALDKDNEDNYIQYTFDEWILKDYNNCVHVNDNMNTVNFEISIPLIIILKYYSKVNKYSISPTTENLWKRDGAKCGYCGKSLKLKDATKDHINPKSKGGENSWTNLITSCKNCNTKKSNIELHHLPDMKLLYEPIHMNPTSILYKMDYKLIENFPNFWKEFFVEFK